MPISFSQTSGLRRLKGSALLLIWTLYLSDLVPVYEPDDGLKSMLTELKQYITEC